MPPAKQAHTFCRSGSDAKVFVFALTRRMDVSTGDATKRITARLRTKTQTARLPASDDRILEQRSFLSLLWSWWWLRTLGQSTLA